MSQNKGISISKLYRDIKSGAFKEPLKKGNKILGWCE